MGESHPVGETSVGSIFCPNFEAGKGIDLVIFSRALFSKHDRALKTVPVDRPRLVKHELRCRVGGGPFCMIMINYDLPT